MWAWCDWTPPLQSRGSIFLWSFSVPWQQGPTGAKFSQWSGYGDPLHLNSTPLLLFYTSSPWRVVLHRADYTVIKKSMFKIGFKEKQNSPKKMLVTAPISKTITTNLFEFYANDWIQHSATEGGIPAKQDTGNFQHHSARKHDFWRINYCTAFSQNISVDWS